MKKSIIAIISVLAGVLVLVILGLNIYLEGVKGEYRQLLTFAKENYPAVSDNSIITDNFTLESKLEINPAGILDKAMIIKEKSEVLKTDVISQYNLLTGQIDFLTTEITELTDQAGTLSLSISDNFEAITSPFTQTSNYDELQFKNARDSFNYLTDYQKYLKNLFQEYKAEKIKQGKFSNPLWGYTDADLLLMLSTMSVEAKAGQLLIFSFDGLALNSGQTSRYKALNPGGMIMMGGNVSNAKQVNALTQQIQKLNTDIPPFIATDQEGGVVKRINWDTTASQKSWAGMTEEEICNLGKQRSKLLLDLGINMNFSPVVDLTNPGQGFMNNRTISGDPKIVTDKSKTYINCGQGLGIIDTLKHFPGHGSTTLDSHFILPVVTKSKDVWLNCDAIPF